MIEEPDQPEGGEETPPEEPAVEETASEDPAVEETASEDPAAEETTAPDEPIPPAAEPEPEPQISEPEALEPQTTEEVVAERVEEAEAAVEEAAEAERRPRGKASERGVKEPSAEVIPGEHLTPDLALTPEGDEGDIERLLAGSGEASDEFVAAGEEGLETPAEQAEGDGGDAQPQAVVRTPVELAAEARYRATGKRKTSVARVILKPGKGEYTINGKPLETYFPRATLQKNARRPLETAGYQESMDVVAKIHGGGVSAQADALRHGIARALIEVDPQLRTDLKRQGFLTRDARAKERKKAGLKKARKRPQFSKR